MADPNDDFPRRPDTSSFLFASTFQGEDALRTGEWVLSEDKRYAGQDSRVRVEPCSLDGGRFAGDYGLLLSESHMHYAVGASLPKPVDNSGKDLVLQYEVQVRDGSSCGGAYVKMLRGAAGGDMATLNSESPYAVMFGPDKCFRETNKVHFIFQHENPNTMDWEEKHFDNAPKIKDDGGFHVYTLHVKTDGTFDLYIDTEVASSGSLLEDMKPPIVPQQEIDDPEDEQPEDWVTEAKIPDPDAVKPEDWDEDAPRKIVDDEAEMPEGWLEDAERFVPDPSSTRPEDWDDEEDGDWEPVMMANPACQQAPGCGKWEKPLVANPAYKGKWSPPKIDNPDYSGEWQPRKIQNPAYFEIEDTEPSRMAPITGLAVEVWTVDGGIWLDNFIVGDDVTAALKLAETTWRPKFDAWEAIAAAGKKQKELERAKEQRASRSTLVPPGLLAGSRLLADKARPFLPDAAVPALDAVAENPIAVIATMLAGLLAMVVLSVMKKGRDGSASRRAKPSATSPASDSGSVCDAPAGAAEASPAELSPATVSFAEDSPAEASPAEASPAEAAPAEASPAEASPAEENGSEEQEQEKEGCQEEQQEEQEGQVEQEEQDGQEEQVELATKEEDATEETDSPAPISSA